MRLLFHSYCKIGPCIYLLCCLALWSCQKEEINQEYKLMVYPNPFAEDVWCDIFGQFDSPVVITVTDASSKEIFRQEISPGSNSPQVFIRMDDHPKGVYLLQADFGDRIEIVKLYKTQ